jgi:protocatechuate 3,4-dioxygenase beta subunit
MYRSLLSSIFFFLIYANNLHAKEKIYQNTLNQCIPTKNILDNYEPLNFNLTNNLISSSKVKDKEDIIPKIFIFGKLLDKKCIPIANATIYAWQVGPDGKYPYEPLRKSVINKNLFTKKKTDFIGSASTVTDNMGNFVLIATYPKKSKNQTSNGINIRATHKDLGTIQTRFELLPFFEEVRSIEYLSFYRSDVTESKSKAYNLKLVMPVNVTFLKY